MHKCNYTIMSVNNSTVASCMHLQVWLQAMVMLTHALLVVTGGTSNSSGYMESLGLSY